MVYKSNRIGGLDTRADLRSSGVISRSVGVGTFGEVQDVITVSRDFTTGDGARLTPSIGGTTRTPKGSGNVMPTFSSGMQAHR